jgi:hypothetical protein
VLKVRVDGTDSGNCDYEATSQAWSAQSSNLLPAFARRTHLLKEAISLYYATW